MSRSGKSHLLLMLLSALWVCGCASTSQVIAPTDVHRTRTWTFHGGNEGREAQVVFVPKGIYLVGLSSDSRLAPGNWVRIIPGNEWTSEASKPTLIVARVVERVKDTARLEMLSYQLGFRDADVQFEAYAENQTTRMTEVLHAMTKRLTFGLSEVHQGDAFVDVPLTEADLVDGTEIYGAMDIGSASTRARLASMNRALLTVGGMGDGLTRLTPVAGVVPESPAFVLLDAPQPPAFHVKIDLSGLSDGIRQEVLRLVEAQLNAKVPGSEFIEAISGGERLDYLQTLSALGQACSDTLEVRLVSDGDSVALADHGYRVHAWPWRVVLSGTDAELAAVGALASAYQMLGYHASSAWVLEQAWAKMEVAESRAALAPALALAYHGMERDDWALEIALELQGYADLASGKTRSMLLTAVAAVYALVGQTSEFSSQWAHIVASELPLPWLRVLAYAQLSADDSVKVVEGFAASKARLLRERAWHESDEMYACYARIEDNEDACEAGMEMASAPFYQAWFETYASLGRATSDEWLERAELVDRLGAPWLASEVWLELLQSGLTTEAVIGVWQNAAAYVRQTQQTRRWLYLMSDLVNFLDTHGQAVSGDMFAGAVKGWRAMDFRSALAGLCRLKAKQAGGAEARELLQFAAELYLSMGDNENASWVINQLKTPEN